MKKQLFTLLAFIVLFTAKLNAQNADLQLIHNSADPALMLVDIYINDSLVADDIIFRSATLFMTLSANDTLNIGIALNTSTSVNDTLKNFEIIMQPGDRYIGLINGVADTAQFASNADGAGTQLNILFQNNIEASATNPANVDYIIAQGATDLSKCDFVIRDDKKIADNIIYNTATAYDSVLASSFTLDITPFNNDSIITSYQVDFTGMDGRAAVLVASGFRDPVANQNGPSFEFFAAFADGSVLEFFPVSIAKLQAINNCADPLLDSIDIYASGVLVVDNFHFRTATTLFNVPGDVPLQVAIAPGNSTSVNDTLRSFTLTFENGKRYIAIATGVIDTASFAPNPDGLNTSFTMVLADGMRWKSQNASDVDFRFVNGITDAPAVDLKYSWGPVLDDNISFGTLTPYNTLTSPGTYNLNVTDSNNTNIYNSYQINLDTLGGQSAVVFFSGFLNPAVNQNGAGYNLFAAFADGKVLPFSIVTGTHNLSPQNEIDLYPNPTNGFLNIKIDALTNGNSTLRIMSVDGKVIREKVFAGNNMQVDLKNIAPGIYFIEVNCEGKTHRSKVVVK
ncbi:MAG: DUF4397 domain-containing protein [Bacteroidia bacterium]